ncbi:hypothetical protein PtB15_2B98 [Puccinia triticina]|nr:hypothetical protein PtB15_2B98 [Puccinia triticina]
MQRTTRIGLLQLEPTFKQPELSIRQADNLISSIEPDEIDLLILPEMAFTVDDIWARPGEGFLVIDLNVARLNGKPGNPVRCCIGICMDLSPDRFEAPFDAYELSNFAVNHNAEMMICSMAWLSSSPVPDPHHTETERSLLAIVSDKNAVSRLFFHFISLIL